MLSQRVQARNIGKSESLFYVMKKENKVGYRYLKFIGKGRLDIGYTKLKEYVEGIRRELQDEFYSDKKKLYELFSGFNTCDKNKTRYINEEIWQEFNFVNITTIKRDKRAHEILKDVKWKED